MRTCLLAAVLVMATTGTGLAQDAEAGQSVFKRMCFPCHDAGPGAKVKLGPPLNGLDGRAAGTMAGFNYSEANKSSGITWDEPTFTEYIKNPKAKIPNTKMVFAGISDDADIDDLIAYLKQFGPDGKITQ